MSWSLPKCIKCKKYAHYTCWRCADHYCGKHIGKHSEKFGKA